MHWNLDLLRSWKCCFSRFVYMKYSDYQEYLFQRYSRRVILLPLDERRTVNIKALMDSNDNEHEKVREVLEGCAELDNSQILNSKFWSAHKDCRVLRRHSYTVAVQTLNTGPKSSILCNVIPQIQSAHLYHMTTWFFTVFHPISWFHDAESDI